MIATLLNDVRTRLAALRTYRRTIAELALMSDRELMDLRADRQDMRDAAWRALTGR